MLACCRRRLIAFAAESIAGAHAASQLDQPGVGALTYTDGERKVCSPRAD
jgi:hypothetical protein